MRRTVILGSAVVALAILFIAPAGAGAAAFTQCPPVFKDTGCQFLVTVTNGGSETVAEDATQGPYEGSDDALIGVQNNSTAPVSSIHLSAEETLFGFDGDGICTPGGPPIPDRCVVLPEAVGGGATLKAGQECGYETEVKGGKPALTETIQESCGFAPPAGEPAGVTFPEGVGAVGMSKGTPVSGYEGPTSWFTGIGALGSFSTGSGTINFSPALAPGQSSFFSLESPPVSGFGSASTLTTSLSGGGLSGPTITVVQGTPVVDTATLAGANATIASGLVSYNVYSDPGCTSLVVAAGAGALSGGAAAASTAESLAPGKYYWQASYPGDINAKGATSACGSEILTVLAPTTTTTTQTGAGVRGSSLTVPLGTAVTDRATLAGTQVKAATGSVSYTLYKDKKCTVPAFPASTGIVTAGVAAASGAVKPKVGTYYWVASYSGDGVLNAPSASACGKEILLVALKANLGLPSSKVCLSRRKFIAHPKAPPGAKLVHVEVLINGKLKSQGPLTKRHTTINLIGLPKGTFKVSMVATSSTGKKYVDIRTFHTCVPKKHKK
jgi:hypothetical protein